MKITRQFVRRFGALALGVGVIATTVMVGGKAQALATTGVIDLRISAGIDDAEQRGRTRMSMTSTDLEMSIDGSTVQIVGLHYPAIAIPAGATITEAWVQFTVDETSGKATTLSIYGDGVDNSAAFSTAPSDLSLRASTAAAVAWTPPAWTAIDAAGTGERTPTLSAVIQEIVSRPGWAPGNAISLLVAGTGTRTARAYESDPTKTPLLHVAYTTEQGPPLPVTTVPATTLPPPATAPASTTPAPATTTPAPVTTAAASTTPAPATTSPAPVTTAAATTIPAPSTTAPRVTTTVAQPTTTGTPSGPSGYTGPTTGAAGSIVPGTYVESPNRIGPFGDKNGNLYFIIELPEAQLTPWMRILKSSDGGRTWAEVDAGNRPSARDLEAVDVQQDKATGELYILQQRSGGTVYYHEFHTSDHASTPDHWAVTDEQPGTDLAPTEQSVAVGHRSDGTTIAVYALMDGSEQHLAVKVRSAAGKWSAQAIVDRSVGTVYDVVGIVTGDSTFHLWYSSVTTGKLYYRTFAASGAISAAQVAASDVGTGSASAIRSPILPPVTYADAAGRTVVVVGYATAGGIVKTITYVNGVVTRTDVASDRAVARDKGTSRQAIASLVNDGSTLYLVYSEAASLDIWTDRNVGGAGWETDFNRLKGVTAHWIRAGVFTHNKANGGRRVLGWIWDMGSDGHVGDSRYDEVALA